MFEDAVIPVENVVGKENEEETVPKALIDKMVKMGLFSSYILKHMAATH